MNYKQLTKQAYDRYSREFEINTISLFNSMKERDIIPFLNSLKGRRILDLGSGPGIHSYYFKQRGLYPVCLDISIEMARLCKQKGLDVLVGDLENLPFKENTFYGIWACTSLLHIPKPNLPRILENMKKILTVNGILYVSVKEGNSEEEVESDKYPGVKRFFALYQDKELRILLDDWEILHKSRNEVGNARFLNYICKIQK